MLQTLLQTKTDTLLVLKPGPNAEQVDVQRVLLECGCNDFQLRADHLPA